jgi:hypothetical protein
LSLFPSDRPIPPDALNAVSVDLARMRLRRPRRIRTGQLTEPTDDGAEPAGDPGVL